MYISTYVYIYEYTYINDICLSLHIYMHLQIYVHIVYIYLYMCIYVYTCTYINIYIHKYIYIYIYIHIYGEPLKVLSMDPYPATRCMADVYGALWFFRGHDAPVDARPHFALRAGGVQQHGGQAVSEYAYYQMRVRNYMASSYIPQTELDLWGAQVIKGQQRLDVRRRPVSSLFGNI